MINCSGNKIPLICVFAAIAIVFIHGLSLAVAPSEPEILEPEARAWATAENEPARPKAGVVFMSYSDPRIDDGHGSGPMMEVVYAGRLLKKIMKPSYRNNQCCNHKDQTDGDCDYAANVGDMDYICECWLGPVPPTPSPTTPTTPEPTTPAPTNDCTDGVEGYSKECSADCSSTTPGTCRYYIRNGDWDVGEARTCTSWCGSQGLTCHAMYDDSGNSCCSYKGNQLSCDYTGDASDKDFICECWP